MPLSSEQTKWLETRFVKFREAQIDQDIGSFLPSLYAEVNRKWPCIPTPDQVAMCMPVATAGAEPNPSAATTAFEVALARASKKRDKVC